MPKKNPLLSDLDQIESTIDDDPEQAIRELFEWNRGFVRQHDVSLARVLELEARMTEAEDVIAELAEGAAEGLSSETAQILLAAFQQAKIAIATFQTLLDSEHSTLDDIGTQRATELNNRTALAIAESMQLIADITIEDDEEENANGDSDDGGNADGTRDDESGDGDDDTATEEAGDETEEASEDDESGDARGA